MRATLYAVPASNAVLTVQLALERKGIPYRRVDQLPVLHRIGMRARGFQGSTVPGLVIEGRKVHGSSAILRELDLLEPEPPLFPADPELRPHAEEALRWGEDVYQCTLRNLLPWSLLRRPGAVASVLQDARMTLPTSLVVRVAKPAIYVNSLINSSNEGVVRRRLAELPRMLDHVDELIASGVLNGEDPGAADLMIAPSTCALLWWEELRPLLDGRRAADHARRVVPRFPGEIPPVFPRHAVPAPAPAA